jgi:hypothetical protein
MPYCNPPQKPAMLFGIGGETMAAKNRLREAAVTIGSVMGKADGTAHKAAKDAAKAAKAAKKELAELSKQVDKLKKQLKKSAKRLKKALK